jgi:hypothetical protein
MQGEGGFFILCFYVFAFACHCEDMSAEANLSYNTSFGQVYLGVG